MFLCVTTKHLLNTFNAPNETATDLVLLAVTCTWNHTIGGLLELTPPLT